MIVLALGSYINKKLGRRRYGSVSLVDKNQTTLTDVWNNLRKRANAMEQQESRTDHDEKKQDSHLQQ